MATNKISQPVDNATLPGQNGGETVVKAAIDVGGGDLLIGFSGSAWSANGNEVISLQLWLDGDTVPAGLLQLYANQGGMHLSLGHVWAYVPGVAAGSHTLSVTAGDTTVTDGNDTVCITVWELGDNIAVHFNESVPCPTGSGQPLVKTAFQTRGQTPVMTSVSTSGWVSNQGIVGATATVDQDIDAQGGLEVFANNTGQHLAAVPTDIVWEPPNRGQHGLVVASEGATWTDQGDLVHVTVVEWVDPAQGPTIVGMNPVLQNQQTNAQQGDGGSIASSTFQSSGGTLLVRTNCSAWSASANVPITVGIQIDGTSRGFLQLFANPNETHMAFVSNDLVITGVQAGQHTLNLMGELNTITDQNDRVSVTIMEF